MGAGIAAIGLWIEHGLAPTRMKAGILHCTESPYLVRGAKGSLHWTWAFSINILFYAIGSQQPSCSGTPFSLQLQVSVE